tara:strand:- start:523 stop:1263 length:741 start_codon:yes stop_codon:yes gene_type:complete
MDLIKDIGKSLKFKERYDDLERTGMEEYDRKECKELRELSKSGAPLSESQKETLHYCDTIKGERTRAAMNLGTSALKIGVGAATGNVGLITQGVGDAGGYVMSEAQEVDGPNDGVGQKIGKEDYMKLGTDIVSGVGAYAMGGQGAEGVGGTGTGGGDGTGTGTGGAGGAGGAGNTFNMMQTLMQNPQFMQMMMQQMQGQQGAQDAFQTGGATGTLDFLAKQNDQGSKLKRSTRQHDYIKGNTRGYR